MEWAVYRTDPPVHRRRLVQEYQERGIWLRVGVSHRSALSLPLVSRQCYLPVVESPDTWHVPVGRSWGVYTTYTKSCSDPA